MCVFCLFLWSICFPWLLESHGALRLSSQYISFSYSPPDKDTQAIYADNAEITSVFAPVISYIWATGGLSDASKRHILLKSCSMGPVSSHHGRPRVTSRSTPTWLSQGKMTMGSGCMIISLLVMYCCLILLYVYHFTLILLILLLTFHIFLYIIHLRYMFMLAVMQYKLQPSVPQLGHPTGTRIYSHSLHLCPGI